MEYLVEKYVVAADTWVSAGIVSHFSHSSCSSSTHVRASLELGGVWRVLVTHSRTEEIETRLQKVSRPMSSDFSW